MYVYNTYIYIYTHTHTFLTNFTWQRYQAATSKPSPQAFEPGLLAKANRGILYVDEVAILPFGNRGFCHGKAPLIMEISMGRSSSDIHNPSFVSVYCRIIHGGYPSDLEMTNKPGLH